jgi:hypothetical protein
VGCPSARHSQAFASPKKLESARAFDRMQADDR